MGFLDRLLGREKKAEDMPAEPPPRSEGAMPDTGGMNEPPPAAPPPGMGQEPGTEGSRPERETP
jgi:hypothetical protein